MKTIAGADDGQYTCDEDQETVVDRNLFKAIGLNKLLRLQVSSGVFVRSYWISVVAAACLNVGFLPMQTVRMYLELRNLQALLPTAVFVAITLNSVFKGYVIVMNADRFRALLEVTLYGFTASGRANPSELLRCRNSLSACLRAYTMYNFITLIVWTVFPLFINFSLPFVKLDGTVGSYRQTVLNWWYPVSEATFNWTPVWTVIWAIETAVCLINAYCWTVFECCIVFICMAMCAQFQTVSSAYESLGRNLPPPPSPSRRTSDCCTRQNDGTKSDGYYEELIRHIKDNQKLVKKYSDFIDIVKPAVVLEITTNTCSVIMFSFITILGYQLEGSILSVRFVRYIFVNASFSQKLFIYCYIFIRLEAAKSSVNFALYSSNWIEMDLKYKKAMLLAMDVNSAHKHVIKLSPNSVVNLEMFTKVMKFSFSIVSVLLNARAGKATNI